MSALPSEYHQSPQPSYRADDTKEASSTFWTPPTKHSSLSSKPFSPPTGPRSSNPFFETSFDNSFDKKRKRDFHPRPGSRSRSSTPPFVPGKPTDAYLAIAAQPSIRLPVPSRKLLVLDLNGTLVFRPEKRRISNIDGSQMRPVHPRPYMRAFALYLQKHETWEAMVWSSAQPFNVDRMVDSAFGQDLRGCLKHVWARDRLGLSAEDFGSCKHILPCVKVLPLTISFISHRQESPDRQEPRKTLERAPTSLSDSRWGTEASVFHSGYSPPRRFSAQGSPATVQSSNFT